MAVPRPILPILEGFSLGECAIRHEANQCCPATEHSSGDAFILKMISIPASEQEMDALLLTGAFSSLAQANEYYKEQARSLLNEAKALRHLATMGGFADFDRIQVVPAENGRGFEMYLLAPRRSGLQQRIYRKDLTQLEMVNVGLDLCAALTTCRQAGYYYVDLKPSNVFYLSERYCIGDLGFVSMDAIGRDSLSARYLSRYTPPELQREGAVLNGTADVYALGLMLYEAYNGGVLPDKADLVGQLFAPPKYADYELAQIILRACAADPAVRWANPQQMGTALARYSQRNGIRSCPIVPAASPIREDPRPEPFLPEEPVAEEPAQELWINRPAPTRRRPAKPRRPYGRWIAAALALLLLAELVIGGYLLLKRKRLYISDFHVTAASDQIILHVDTQQENPDGWLVTYWAEGVARSTVYFPGTSFAMTGLEDGLCYTFTLSAVSGQKLTGQTRTQFTVPSGKE